MARWLGIGAMWVALAGARPGEALAVDLDAAQFRHDAESTYLEIYYACDEQELFYRRNDTGGYEGTLDLRAMVRGEDDSVRTQRWRVAHVVADTAGGLVGIVKGVVAVTIPATPGRLRIEALSGVRPPTVAEFDVGRAEGWGGGATFSDLELCSSIGKAASAASDFYKNTLEVVPNPGRRFDDGAPLLYYMEIYNLAEQGGEVDSLHLRAAITNSNGETVTVREKWRRYKGGSAVEFGQMPLEGFPTGTYRLEVTLAGGLESARSVKKFYVRSAVPLQASAPGGVGSTAILSDDGVAAEIEQVEALMTDAERTTHTGLSSPETRRTFLADFWQRRAPAGTEGNPARDQFLSRLATANSRFGTGPKPGWKTDRGRIWIVYGPPDEVERHISEMGVRPHESWHYHRLQGGAIFVFADLFGFQDYLLIHSTARGELRDDAWRTQVEE